MMEWVSKFLSLTLILGQDPQETLKSFPGLRGVSDVRVNQYKCVILNKFGCIGLLIR